MNVRIFIWLTVCTGAALWLPVLLYRCRKRVCGLYALIALAAVSGLLLFMAEVSMISCMLFGIYEAVLCFFSYSMISILRTFDRYVPPEGVLGTVCIFLFTPVVVCNVAHDNLFCSLALISSPQSAVGDICGINIFRAVYYDIAPASDYFILIPSWWKSASMFAVTACVLIGAKAGIIRWLSLKADDNSENRAEVC